MTGSRDWEDYLVIMRGISLALADLMEEFPDDNEVVIVHGDCETGADKMADEFGNKLSRLLSTPRTKTGKSYSVRVERHHADWDKYGKAAGPIRNKKMVQLGANICLAYILNNSKGASGCAKMAEEAGIEVVYYRANTLKPPTLLRGL